MDAPNDTACPFCTSADVEEISATRLSWMLVCNCCSKTFSITKPSTVRDVEREEIVEERWR